ncbi:MULTISPECIES: M15 family metallopeptidase [unclassified Acinetobacter]|uniref:M15 family metallopeptidase n=1 Tax=unclassified Acinetobacter TaxID=196816 RepID=UPI0035B77B53
MKKKQLLTTGAIIGSLALIPAVFALTNQPAQEEMGPAATSAIKTIAQGNYNEPQEGNTLNGMESNQPTVSFNDSNVPNANYNSNVMPVTHAANMPPVQTPNNALCTPHPEAASVGIKHYRFPEQTNLVSIGNGYKMHPDAAQALSKMMAAARQDGVTLTVGSAFRSVAYQQGIVDRKKAAGQKPKQLYFMSAPAGYSEHHTGFALDFSPINPSFAKTKGYTWLLSNAGKYGFKQTYTAAYSAKSGVSEESWHWKFTDSPAAQQALAAQSCY